MCPLLHPLAEKEVLWSYVGYQIGKLSLHSLPALDQEELMVIKDFWPPVESLWCTKPRARESTWKPVSKFDGWASFFHLWLHSCSHVRVLHGLIVLGQEWPKRGSGAPQDEELLLQHKDCSHPFSFCPSTFQSYSLQSQTTQLGHPPILRSSVLYPQKLIVVPMCCFRLLVIQTPVH